MGMVYYCVFFFSLSGLDNFSNKSVGALVDYFCSGFYLPINIIFHLLMALFPFLWYTFCLYKSTSNFLSRTIHNLFVDCGCYKDKQGRVPVVIRLPIFASMFIGTIILVFIHMFCI